MKFAKKINKNVLFKIKIYLLLIYKLKKVKKCLNEYLKKEFIVFNYALLILSILFIKKLNKDLRFYINYRKLNAIIKKNRYFISLINEILIKI